MSGETLIKCLQRVRVDSPYRWSGERLVYGRGAGPDEDAVRYLSLGARGVSVAARSKGGSKFGKRQLGSVRLLPTPGSSRKVLRWGRRDECNAAAFKRLCWRAV